MKKTMVLCLAMILLFCMTASMAAKADGIPTKVKVISQSCSAEVLYLTVIDLDCNEVVILCYYPSVSTIVKGKLQHGNVVIRTGMFVDPNEQGFVIGQDAPFEEDKDQGTNPNSMNNSY